MFELMDEDQQDEFSEVFAYATAPEEPTESTISIFKFMLDIATADYSLFANQWVLFLAALSADAKHRKTVYKECCKYLDVMGFVLKPLRECIDDQFSLHHCPGSPEAGTLMGEQDNMSAICEDAASLCPDTIVAEAMHTVTQNVSGGPKPQIIEFLPESYSYTTTTSSHGRR